MLFSVPDIPQKMPLPVGDLDLHIIYGSLGPPELVHPLGILEIDIFIGFCRKQIFYEIVQNW